MMGFEPRTSGVWSDRSANWATTTVCPDVCWNTNNHCERFKYLVFKFLLLLQGQQSYVFYQLY